MHPLVTRSSIEPFTGLAISYAGEGGQGGDEALAQRDRRARERKELSDLILQGSF